ncbi:MAG: flagellar filament capping protein FliD [Oscillospiraceae bacterium]|nr:flagellar filament capping protein FliD [Oscillospiraceae bacterium]
MSTVKETARMAGLISGLDTESLIKAATANTTNAINSRKQKLQTLQWKQEAYRDIITKIQDFQSKYLDITSKDSIRANAVMKSNKATSSNDRLNVSASSSATPGDYTITALKKATAAKLGGENIASRGVQLDFSNPSITGEQTVKVTLDGVTKNVKFNKVEDAETSAQNFLDALNQSFEGILKKDDAGHATQFKYGDSGMWQLTLDNMAGDKVSHIFTVGYHDAVGLKNDASNTISSQATLGSVDFTNRLNGSKFEFSINGVDFSFDKDTKIADMMSEINKSDAGVKMTFSGLTQSFTLESTTTGAGSTLELEQKSGNLLNALFNIDGKALGSAPTYAEFAAKELDSSAKFTFFADSTGFGSADDIIINGTKLGVTGLGQHQEYSAFTYKGKDGSDKTYDNAAVYFNYSDDATQWGKKVFKYINEDTGYTTFANADGTTMFTVEGGKLIDADGAEIEGYTKADDYLKSLGYDRKYKDYSSGDYAAALNEAYTAAFGSSAKGQFSVSVNNTGIATITFDPRGDMTTIEGKGNVNLIADESGREYDGPTYNGKASNFTIDPFPTSHVVASGSLAFVKEGTDEIVDVKGTGENGEVTIQDMIDARDKDGNAIFAYDEETGRLTVTGKNVLMRSDVDSEGNDIDINAIVDLDKAFGAVKLVGSDITGSMIKSGENGMITVNGVTLESSSNVFSIDGTTFGIDDVEEFDESDIAAGKAEEIKVNVAKDNSKIKEVITNFMEGYNKLLDDIYAQISTARPKDGNDYYDPLTDDQKEEMSDKEIEKWEEKAKTGLLYHDTTLTKVFNKLRSAINGNVGGFTIQALGIDTSNKIEEYGKLRFMDGGEATLDAAIERYGDELAAFFTDPENGLAAKLNNAVNAAIDTKTDSRGNAKGLLTSMAGVVGTRSEKKNMIYSQIEAMQKVIDRLKERYETQYERLWKQYSQLETYMMNMSNQSSSLFNSTLYGMNSGSES